MGQTWYQKERLKLQTRPTYKCTLIALFVKNVRPKSHMVPSGHQRVLHLLQSILQNPLRTTEKQIRPPLTSISQLHTSIFCSP